MSTDVSDLQRPAKRARSPEAGDEAAGPSSAAFRVFDADAFAWQRSAGDAASVATLDELRAWYKQRLADIRAHPPVPAKADMKAVKELHAHQGGAPDQVWGHVRGVEVGSLFEGKGELWAANVHTNYMKGIAAKGAGKPATCIALSGGYGDDDDTGDTVWYTGEGGQDANRAQVRDQTLTGGNLSLSLNKDLKCPVRVVRRLPNTYNYSYEGLYEIASMKLENSGAKKNGYLVYRFELRRLPGEHAKPAAEPVAFRFSLLSWARHVTTEWRSTSRPTKAAGARVPAIDEAAEAARCAATALRPHLLCSDVSSGAERLRVPIFNETGDGAGLADALPPGFTYIRHSAVRVSDAARAVADASRPIGVGEGDASGVAVSGSRVYRPGGAIAATEPGGIVESSPHEGVVASGLARPLEVFRTAEPGKGWGVRCSAELAEGSFVVEYAGAVCTTAEWEAGAGEAAARGDVKNSHYVFNLDHFVADAASALTVDAFEVGNVCRFINHAPEQAHGEVHSRAHANCLIQPVFVREHATDRLVLYRICVFARRRIAPFEELTYCYGDKYWEVEDASEGTAAAVEAALGRADELAARAAGAAAAARAQADAAAAGGGSGHDTTLADAAPAGADAADAAAREDDAMEHASDGDSPADPPFVAAVPVAGARAVRAEGAPGEAANGVVKTVGSEGLGAAATEAPHPALALGGEAPTNDAACAGAD